MELYGFCHCCSVSFMYIVADSIIAYHMLFQLKVSYETNNFSRQLDCSGSSDQYYAKK